MVLVTEPLDILTCDSYEYRSFGKVRPPFYQDLISVTSGVDTQLPTDEPRAILAHRHDGSDGIWR